MPELHESEIDILLALADSCEADDRPMRVEALRRATGLELAEFARRLRYLVSIGLIRSERERPLAEPGASLLLTGAGSLRVVAERVLARDLPRPGVRSRLSALAADDYKASS